MFRWSGLVACGGGVISCCFFFPHKVSVCLSWFVADILLIPL